MSGVNNHGGTERAIKNCQIIGAAIEVHRELGPGLLESAYEACLCYELSLRQIPVTRQVLPVTYKSMRVDCGYRVDVIDADKVVAEKLRPLKP